jgi:WD40-like Beta Propeller Repeat
MSRTHPALAAAAVCVALAVGACTGKSGQPAPDRRASSSATSTSPVPPLVVGTPANLGAAVNGPGFDGGPAVSGDGLVLYFVSDRPGGQGGGDVWVARRPNLTSSFGGPENLGPTVNTAGNEGGPSISADGLSLYVECFESDPNARCRHPDLGAPDIWVATRASPVQAFSAITNLGQPVNSTASDGFPAIAHDSLTLYLSSDRPGGSGGPDLWRAVRPDVAKSFQTVENLGPVVNSGGYDGGAALTVDGLILIFSSDRPGGSGGTDLWVATRSSAGDPFGAPVNLGPTVNTPGVEDRPAISGDGSTLYFMSDRQGGLGAIDIWQATIKRTSA